MILQLCRKIRANLLVLVVLAAIPLSIFSNDPPTALDLEETASRLSAQWSGPSVREAISLHLRASEEFAKIKDFASAAQSLRRAARLQALTGDRGAAIRALEKALEFQSDLGPIETIQTLALYSRIMIEDGQAAQAEQAIQKAEKLLPSADTASATAYILRGRAELKENRGDFAGAETDYLAALAAWDPNGDLGWRARTLLLLAGIRIPLGKPLTGLDNCREAMEIFRRLDDRQGMVRSHILSGHQLTITGKHQQALDEYLQAEKDFPADLARIERARLLNGIGYAYQELGEFELALVKREEALALLESEKYWIAVAITLPSMLELNFKLGRDEKALEYLKAAEDLAKKTNYHLGLAVSHLHLGDHYSSIGQDEQAAVYYRRALLVAERSKLPVFVAIVRNNLGSIAARKGSTGVAREHFEKSLEISRRIHNELVESNTLFEMAELELTNGRTLEALRLSQASIASVEQISSTVRNSNLRRSHFASVFERYELQVHLLMKAAAETGDLSYMRSAIQAAERSRARSFVEDLALTGTDLTADAPPDLLLREKELLASLSAASDKLGNLVSPGIPGPEIAKAESEIAKLRFDLEQLRSELRQTSPLYSAIKDPPQFDLEHFRQHVLDDRSVLLEFFLGERESYLWVASGDRFSGYRLPPRAEIESRVSALREILKQYDPSGNGTIEEHQARIASADVQYWIAARELSDILLGQAAPEIAGKRLVIVSDGSLHSLPFSALPLPFSGLQEPIAASTEVVYQPSAQTLTFLQNAGDRRTRAVTNDLIIFSDPVFSRDDERLHDLVAASEENDPALNNFRLVESLNSLTRLRGSGREADAVVQALGSSVDRREGFAATRDALTNEDLTSYKVIHIATHALANTERPDQSGIVLSRYGKNGDPLNEMVRLQDIYSLRLDCDLVVLSACETAVGKDLKGEGLLSLNNAFLKSGSKTVVSTLWKVEDEATRTLMSSFYHGLVDQKLTSSEALRRAQVELMQVPRFRSPFYWAAFTIHGDLNVRPDIKAPSKLAAYAVPIVIAAFCLLGIGLAWTRLRKTHRLQN